MLSDPGRRSIAHELRRLVLLSTLPLAALVVALTYAGYREARNDAEEFTKRQSDLVANEVRLFLDQTERGLALIARRPGVAGMDPAHCDPGLGDLIAIQPRYLNISLIDRNGTIVCATAFPPDGTRSIRISEAKAFQGVMAGKPFALGAVRKGPASRRWIAVAAVPVHDREGKTKGMVAVIIDLAGWLGQGLPAPPPPGVILGAMEKTGTIALRAPEPDKWVGKDGSKTALFAEILRVGEGTFFAPGVQGFDRIWAVTPIPGTDWIAFAGVRAGTALGEAVQQTAIALALVLAAIFACAWAAIRASRRLTLPVAHLADVATRLTAGDTAARASVSGPTEIAVVAQAFNRMLDVRERSAVALTESEARFRDFAGASADWFWETDAEDRYTWISGALEKSIHQPAEAYLGRSRIEMAREAGVNLSIEPWRSHLEVLARHEPFRDFVVHRVIAQEEFWLKVSGVPKFDTQGRFQGYRAITSNISAQVLKEREMQAADQRLKEALGQSELRYRALVEWSPEANVVHRDGTLVYANPAAVRLFGGRTEADLIGKPILDLIHPESRARLLEDLNVIAVAGAPARAERKCVRLDGTVFEVEGQAVAIVYDGAPAIHVIVRDITDRRNAEDLQQSARLRLQTILSNVYGAILLVSDAGRIEFANQAYCEFFEIDRPQEELIGMQSADMLHLIEDRYADPAASLEGIRALIAAGQPARDQVVKMRRNRTFVRDFIPIVIGGAPFGRLWFHRDVTEHFRLRESILEMKNRLSAVIDASMDAIISVDENEQVVVFSTAAEQLFKLDAAEAMGQSLERFIPVRFRGGHHKHMQAFRQSGVSVRTMGQFSRISALRPDGTEFPIEASISHVVVEGRHLFTVTLRDMTRRVQAEAARASLEAQLREAQKMAAVGTLAGGIAHDFNNILATILGNAELASEDAGENASIHESLDEIRKAGSRARNLVQQILSFSRRQPTERKLIALAPIVDEAVRLLRAMLPARLSLEVSNDPDAPEVLADATQIQQILINLATNAMQAMRGSSGRIGIRIDTLLLDAAYVRTHPALIALHAKHPGHALRLTVTDDGPGMEPAVLERIFEPFFTTKPVNEGTGLGLSVVHGIVETHEGAIEVTSLPGQGATFAIYLPVAAAQAEGLPPAQAAAATPAPKPAAGQHILYLDDDQALVSLTKRLLERRGYHVSAYTNQREALAALRAEPHRFNLLVTDYNMPGMSGLDVARAARLIRADLPVAVASGFVDEALSAQAAEAGVREVIFKATAVEEYCAVVARLAQAI